VYCGFKDSLSGGLYGGDGGWVASGEEGHAREVFSTRWLFLPWVAGTLGSRAAP